MDPDIRCASGVAAKEERSGDGVCRLDGTIGDGLCSVFEPSNLLCRLKLFVESGGSI